MWISKSWIESISARVLMFARVFRDGVKYEESRRFKSSAFPT